MLVGGIPDRHFFAGKGVMGVIPFGKARGGEVIVFVFDRFLFPFCPQSGVRVGHGGGLEFFFGQIVAGEIPALENIPVILRRGDAHTRPRRGGDGRKFFAALRPECQRDVRTIAGGAAGATAAGATAIAGRIVSVVVGARRGLAFFAEIGGLIAVAERQDAFLTGALPDDLLIAEKADIQGDLVAVPFHGSGGTAAVRPGVFADRDVVRFVVGTVFIEIVGAIAAAARRQARHDHAHKAHQKTQNTDPSFHGCSPRCKF